MLINKTVLFVSEVACVFRMQLPSGLSFDSYGTP